jgi:hypothetical protein
VRLLFVSHVTIRIFCQRIWKGEKQAFRGIHNQQEEEENQKLTDMRDILVVKLSSVVSHDFWTCCVGNPLIRIHRHQHGANVTKKGERKKKRRRKEKRKGQKTKKKKKLCIFSAFPLRILFFFFFFGTWLYCRGPGGKEYLRING